MSETQTHRVACVHAQAHTHTMNHMSKLQQNMGEMTKKSYSTCGLDQGSIQGCQWNLRNQNERVSQFLLSQFYYYFPNYFLWTSNSPLLPCLWGARHGSEGCLFVTSVYAALDVHIWGGFSAQSPLPNFTIHIPCMPMLLDYPENRMCHAFTLCTLWVTRLSRHPDWHQFYIF